VESLVQSRPLPHTWGAWISCTLTKDNHSSHTTIATAEEHAHTDCAPTHPPHAAACSVVAGRPWRGLSRRSLPLSRHAISRRAVSMSCSCPGNAVVGAGQRGEAERGMGVRPRRLGRRDGGCGACGGRRAAQRLGAGAGARHTSRLLSLDNAVSVAEVDLQGAPARKGHGTKLDRGREWYESHAARSATSQRPCERWV